MPFFRFVARSIMARAEPDLAICSIRRANHLSNLRWRHDLPRLRTVPQWYARRRNRRGPHRRGSSLSNLREHGPTDHGGTDPAPRRHQGDRAAQQMVPWLQSAQRSGTSQPTEYSGELDLRADQTEAAFDRSAAERSLPLPGYPVLS